MSRRHPNREVQPFTMRIDTTQLNHQQVNQALLAAGGDCTLCGCLGQRFIGAGLDGGCVLIEGIPGNALGAYLNGATLCVQGNAQDAVGDTMNAGRIVIHGSVGDAVGYAMRGGCIFVQGDAGYRAGVHMKAYGGKVPAIVIGGCAGSFLGEYQAGGTLVVLGLGHRSGPLVGAFPCTGMHGGKLFLRGSTQGVAFPSQVTVRPAQEEDLAELTPLLQDYCAQFGLDPAAVLDAPFTVVTPDSRNPYRQMYVAN